MELGEAKLQQVEASWQSFKQRGWAVHFIDLTSLYLRLKIGAGRAVKARLVDSALTSSKHLLLKNKKNKSSKRSLKKRAPFRESHYALAPVPNLRTPKLQQAFKPLLFYGIFKEAPFYSTKKPSLFSDDAPWAKGGTILFLSSIVPQVGWFVSSFYLRNSLSSFVIMLGER